MKSQFRSKQRGGIFMVLILVALLAMAAVVGAQVFPTLLEWQAVHKAAVKSTEGATVAQVKSIFQKAADIDNISSITPNDLDIVKDGDKMLVKYAYSKEIHLFGPAYLLMKYSGSTKTN